MPFRPRTSRRSYRKKTFKRPFKRPNRKRYSKKRNTVNQLTMRAPLASRMLRVKLPYCKIFNGALDTIGTTFNRFCFQGNGIFPYTVGAQTSTTGYGLLSNGDVMPAGVSQYSQFYDKYVIDASSITVETLFPNIDTIQRYRTVLLAVPYTQTTNQNLLFADNDNWNNTRDQLDSYDYEQLLAWPFAKWRLIGSNDGGASHHIMKMYRKTKAMSQVKDLRDNNLFVSNLTDGQISFEATAETLQYNPSQGFMYYLRYFPVLGGETDPQQISITVRMKLYVTMFSREFNPNTKIVIEEDPEDPENP